MGAWGYEALDSDQALDWLGNAITDHINDEVRKLVRLFDHLQTNHGSDNRGIEHYGMELRAAAHVLVKLANGDKAGDAIFVEDASEPDDDLYLLMADRLAQMASADDWINGWTNPEEVRNSIKEQVAALVAISAKSQPEV